MRQAISTLYDIGILLELAVRRLRDRKRDYERVYQQQTFFAPRVLSFWCTDCDVIGGNAHRCPHCHSTALLSMAHVLQGDGVTIHVNAA